MICVRTAVCRIITRIPEVCVFVHSDNTHLVFPNAHRYQHSLGVGAHELERPT